MLNSRRKDVLEGVYAQDPIDHPIAFALTEAVHSCGLSKAFLTKILNARVRFLSFHFTQFLLLLILFQKKDLRVMQPRTMADLETYAEDTASSLLYLTLESLGVRNQDADHAASHLGLSHFIPPRSGLISSPQARPKVS